jgi:hypothetical protein
MQLKDAVRLAYGNPPVPAVTHSHWNRNERYDWYRNAVAAMLLLAAGVAGGWKYIKVESLSET